MSYGMSQAVIARLEESNLTEEQRERLADACWIVNWAGEACPTIHGEESNEGIRVISRSALAKTFRFQGRESSEGLDAALAVLERLEITSPPIEQESTGGRKRHNIYLSDRFSPPFETADIERAVVSIFLADTCEPYGSDEEGAKDVGCHCGTLHTPELEPEPGLTPSAIQQMVEAARPEELPAAPAERVKHPTEASPRQINGFEVVCLHDFNMMFNGMFLSWRKGQTIEDPLVAQAAVRDNMPVIKLGEEPTKQYCPRCQRVAVRAELADGTPVSLRAQAPFVISWAGQLISCHVDKIITEPLLVRFMLANPTSCPVLQVYAGKDFNQCQCGHFILTDKPLS